MLFNNLKDALMDQEFHKKLVQQVVLSAVVAVVAVTVKQVSEVLADEIQNKIADLKTEQPESLEVAQ